MKATFTHLPQSNQVLVQGNTYPVRAELKALGGKWNPRKKGWLLPCDMWEAAEQAMWEPESGKDFDELETEKYNAVRSDYISHLSVTSSGHEMYQNKQGRCEDAPCCGCCNY
jgi:hypothetical protein